MNLASIIILAVVAVLFVLAVRYSIQHKDSCAECGGSCTGMCSSCNHDQVDLDKVPERFRLKKNS